MAGKYSQELATAWVVAYEELGAVSFACDSVGISKDTFYKWMERGERGDPLYQQFYFEARKARAKTAGKLIKLTANDKGGPAFLLERLFPIEFGTAGKAQRDALQVLLDLVMPLLTEPAQRELLDALSLLQRQRAGASEPGVADSEAAGVGAIETEGELIEHRQLESGSE